MMKNTNVAKMTFLLAFHFISIFDLSFVDAPSAGWGGATREDEVFICISQIYIRRKWSTERCQTLFISPRAPLGRRNDPPIEILIPVPLLFDYVSINSLRTEIYFDGGSDRASAEEGDTRIGYERNQRADIKSSRDKSEREGNELTKKAPKTKRKAGWRQVKLLCRHRKCVTLLGEWKKSCRGSSPAIQTNLMETLISFPSRCSNFFQRSIWRHFHRAN